MKRRLRQQYTRWGVDGSDLMTCLLLLVVLTTVGVAYLRTHHMLALTGSIITLVGMIAWGNSVIDGCLLRHRYSQEYSGKDRLSNLTQGS